VAIEQKGSLRVSAERQRTTPVIPIKCIGMPPLLRKEGSFLEKKASGAAGAFLFDVGGSCGG